MADVKKYTVTLKDRQRSLARMLSNTDTVKVGLTGGQKRALAAKASRETTTAA